MAWHTHTRVGHLKQLRSPAWRTNVEHASLKSSVFFTFLTFVIGNVFCNLVWFISILCYIIIGTGNIKEDVKLMELSNGKEPVSLTRDREKWRSLVATSSSVYGWRKRDAIGYAPALVYAAWLVVCERSLSCQHIERKLQDWTDFDANWVKWINDQLRGSGGQRSRSQEAKLKLDAWRRHHSRPCGPSNSSN